jgi:hypothetical protein
LDNNDDLVKELEPIIIKEIHLINIDSKIIAIQQAELILKWIDKSDKLTNSYEFKLLYHDSCD